MLADIVNIQPKDSGGGSGETRETIVYRLCDDMLEKLPDDFIPHEVWQQIMERNIISNSHLQSTFHLP